MSSSPGPVMAHSPFLDMSPDKLLETHSVAEAEVVASQLSRWEYFLIF